jgi:putative ABC transport system permease protein
VKQGGLEEEEKPQTYLPYFQAYRDGVPRWDPVIVVRTAAEPKNLIPTIRAKLLALDKELVVFRLRTMEQVVAESTAPLRFRAQLMGTFGALAVLLAMLGVYGLVSYSVAARTHEIGVRMALGAERANIVRMVLLQGARVAVLGAVIGVGAAWGLGRFLTRLLFGTSPTDPATLAVSAVALVLVALAACAIPAARASRVEPAAALRYE